MAKGTPRTAERGPGRPPVRDKRVDALLNALLGHFEGVYGVGVEPAIVKELKAIKAET